MALGVPVVSTAVMGTKDILDAGRGALVATEKVDDFCGKVTRLLSDRNLRQRLSAEAHGYAEEWSAERNAERLVDFYELMLKQHAARSAAGDIVADSGN
jgi:glycosyltransferase involved in cell wall biosynthesis